MTGSDLMTQSACSTLPGAMTHEAESSRIVYLWSPMLR